MKISLQATLGIITLLHAGLLSRRHHPPYSVPPSDGPALRPSSKLRTAQGHYEAVRLPDHDADYCGAVSDLSDGLRDDISDCDGGMYIEWWA
ncbi:hypothetical protein TgHK011_001849 [Trichoderma gracile]|nr:hypothetical protein TgHK011_001849 [Trichoderma gracile]